MRLVKPEGLGLVENLDTYDIIRRAVADQLVLGTVVQRYVPAGMSVRELETTVSDFAARVRAT